MKVIKTVCQTLSCFQSNDLDLYIKVTKVELILDFEGDKGHKKVTVAAALIVLLYLY